ncbi:RNA polymerase I-specific transcription initiation factor RRN3-like isoform X2 [Adelges cooleyi]|uniref:RNA polymerase I-specific transcription initiation factor RRN3-like isoform X2 n=1 Tax=Adelges cooleyi TaxID=133065 RepID=UPI0021806F09|nr:RNA polymerase I-specific transcription initiation factor RRN3-like isoform X2 [Adelges cooleyi]XP_050436124.1 RNA polymerase I-specific transcription initiation factor RRN3-like isoform X2 [Adelges cooleyi]
MLSHIQDAELIKLLKDARNCINILNENLTLFVKVILVLKWMNRSDEVVNEYRKFLLDVCSAHNYHTKFAIEQLVSCFSEVNSLVVDRVNGMPSEDEEKGYQNVHKTLRDLLKVIPLAKDILMAALQKKFPFKRNNPEAHLHYIHNLFMILDYEPSLRKNILGLIIHKLVEIDAHIPKEELDRLKNCLTVETEDIFEMDIDEASMQADPVKREAECLLRTLDLSILRIFEFFNLSCHDKDGILIWDNTKSLYQDLLAVFESEILPTYASSHIQYIVYYFVSFKATLSEKFSNYLWKKCCDMSAPSTLRQAAAGYLASFLSRAPFVSINVLKTALSDLSTWCVNYINRVDKSVKVVNEELLRWHAVFYSMCQALFYVIAFRHEDLMDSKRNLKFMENLNLSKIVTSRLSPLRICCSKVANHFAHITKTYQLTYCYTVMDGHIRVTDQAIKEQWLYSFFPFEPYVLPRSKDIIMPNLFRDFGSNLNGSSTIEEDEEKDSSLIENMDISPSFLTSSSPAKTDWLRQLISQQNP